MRKGTDVSNVADLRVALEEARANHEDAQVTSSTARAHLDELVASIAAGGSDVTPADLAQARSAVEHADLALPGAERRLQECSAALDAAESDAALDQILAGLHDRTTAVTDTYGPLLDALAKFASATGAYEAFVSAALSDNHMQYASNPRIRSQRHGAPSIDGVQILRCRPAAQLCKLIAPELRALGAPQSFLENVRLYAAGAPDLEATQ